MPRDKDTSYEALIFLPPGTDASLQYGRDRLVQFYSDQIEKGKARITFEDGKLTVRLGKWSIEVYEDEGLHVLREADDIASTYGLRLPNRGMLALARRVFVLSSDQDPRLEHGEDYFDVVVQLSEFPGAVAFDPGSGTFI
jgi:hypothetical protein